MRITREREICFTMHSQGHTQQTIAAALGVNRRTISRWLRRGSPQVTTTRPARRRLSSANEASVVAFFANNNTATLKQAAQYLRDDHGLVVCLWTVWKCCQKHRMSWKKGSKAYSEMSETRAQQFLQDISVGFGQQVLALDEAAFFWNHVRGYAWAPKGCRAVIKCPGIRGQMHSLLLAISTSGVVKWQLYDGAVNAARFSQFLQALPCHSRLVLDNAVIHRATNVLRRQGLPTVPEVADARQISLHYLPPYAPVLNPVELCFNSIRTYINREHPRTKAELMYHIEGAVNTLTRAVCEKTMRKVWRL